MTEPGFIGAVGIACPAGVGADTMHARIASGDVPIARHAGFFNRDYEAQLCLAAGSVADPADRGARLHALAQAALAQIAVPRADLAVLLLPKGGDAADLGQLVAAPETIVHHGASGDLAMLLQDMLARRDWQSATVLVADSLVAKSCLSALDAEGALFSRQNPWGVLPSEAAVVLCLTRQPEGPMSSLTAARAAHEPTGPTDCGPALFTGMSDALNAALDASGAQPAETRIISGDCGQGRYHASEQAHAIVRAGHALARDLTQHAPCRVLGDCGAAGMALALALAVTQAGQGMRGAVTGSGQAAGWRGAVCWQTP